MEALQRVTRAVPIVFVTVIDPVGSGFVESLCKVPPRPAGMPPHAHFIALNFDKELSPSAANFRVFTRYDRR